MKPIQVVSLVLLLLLSSCSKDQPLKPSQPPTLTDPSGKILALPWARIEPDPSTVAMVADSTWHTFQVHTDAESLRVKVNTDSVDVILELATGSRAPISSYCPGEPNDEKKRKAAIRNGMVVHLQVCGEGTGEIVLEEYVYDHPLTHYTVQIAPPPGEVAQYGPGSVASDRAVLTALYDSLRTGSGYTSRYLRERKWGSSSSLAKWYGVEVDAEGRVVGLDLSYEKFGIAGPLLAELARLDRLIELRASCLWGPMPPEWGQLERLEVLDVVGQGPIPEEWSQLERLRYLKLSQVTRVPETLGNLTALDTLILRVPWDGTHPQPAFEVPLPDRLFEGMDRLKYVQILGQAGPLPMSLGQLPALEVLYIERYDFQIWSLPDGWGAGLTALKEFDALGHSGPVPPEWSAWTQVRKIQAGPFEGPLPAEWGALEQLEILRVPNFFEHYAGRLTGPLPTEWAGMTALKELYLPDHELTGPLPAEWSAMQNLEEVRLEENLLEGPLPASWGTLGNLRLLHLDYNPISGPLPEAWSGMARLEELYCEGCELTGPIPQSWAEMTALQKLNLKGNSLSGEIPDIWQGMSNLEVLVLGGTFTGELPQSLGYAAQRAWHRRWPYSYFSFSVSNEDRTLTGCAPVGLRRPDLNPADSRYHSGSRLPFCDWASLY